MRASVLPLLALLLAPPALADHSPRHMHVEKSPACECCTAWVEIARRHGFEVTVAETDDLAAAKRAAGVPEALAGCHTAQVGGYVVEGHVPMSSVERLLAEKPPVAGLSVPGMPIGSPGMGDDPDARFDVVTIPKAGGTSTVFEAVGVGK